MVWSPVPKYPVRHSTHPNGLKPKPHPGIPKTRRTLPSNRIPFKFHLLLLPSNVFSGYPARKNGRKEETHVLHYSLVFLVFAIVAAVLGFGGIAGMAAGFAKILFFVFLVVWLITFLLGRRGTSL